MILTMAYEYKWSFGTFDEVDASNVGARWEQWKARFMNLLVALDITGTKKQNRQNSKVVALCRSTSI